MTHWVCLQQCFQTSKPRTQLGHVSLRAAAHGCMPEDERLVCGLQALLEEVEAGQDKLTQARKHADACQAKIDALDDK